MTKYNDEEELAKLHTIEDEREGIPRPTYGVTDFDPTNVSDESMFFLGQIKELQEELEREMIKVQRLEMSILGYSHALQESLQGKK
jgi:hypothetical protein